MRNSLSMARQQYHEYQRLLLDKEFAMAPANATTRGAEDSSFDSNMVIVLAALLCALICALGLNSIVRCALRCGHRIAFETPDQTAARLASTGLKKGALSQIPVVAYRPGGLDIPGTGTDCPICLGEFGEGEKVRVLPHCNHGYHVKCIDTWFVSHSSCPTCRQLLLFTEEEDEVDDDDQVVDDDQVCIRI